MRDDLRSRVFNINSHAQFLTAALELFDYQYNNNVIYRSFLDSLGRNPKTVKTISEIPFLPVEFFRNQKIVSGELPVEMIFRSSGTTGFTPGSHYVNDLTLYEESFLKSFTRFYGDPGDYLFLALLPSYTERGGSSLVYMVDKLIKISRHKSSGFYRDNTEELLAVISSAKKEKQKILLLGVSHALLDLAEKYSPDLSDVIVMETGGMKGRRKELTREELHMILKGKFNLQAIHSEYGMTELMSQAYSQGEGIFYTPPWMKIVIRDPHDPLSIYAEPGKSGGISIIDLANIDSCAFIAAGDLGKLHNDGGFEVSGRFDSSDIRGCNLLIE
jgi:phenylacetate-coenzyme A ligase PaaK-like adenylate-forming protein